MDGRIREGGCQDDEEMCDVCIRSGHVQESSIMAIRDIVRTEQTADKPIGKGCSPDEDKRGHKRPWD